MSDYTVTRREVGETRLSLLDDIYVEAGDVSDWKLLNELHYKATNLDVNPQYYRCALAGHTIGVGVLTVPKMLSAGRNEVFKHLKPNQEGKDTRMVNRHRAIWLNRRVQTNSRLVLDTIYRGAGVAYRMQNLMLRMSGSEVIEFQSSMSKFNPFAAKAGIKFVKPRRSAHYEKGLTWFRRWFECQPVDHTGVLLELAKMPAAVREKCILEMRGLYYSVSSMEKTGDNRMKGTSRVDALEVPKLLSNLQQVVFASPLYGVYMNPDFDRELPERIYLSAFENQKVDEPLDLTKL